MIPCELKQHYLCFVLYQQNVECLHLGLLIFLSFLSLKITNPELPEDSLRKRYANIEGFFTLSSLTGKVCNTSQSCV